MTATQDAIDTTSASGSTTAPTTHQGILDFVNEVAAMTTPARIHWCTGSDLSLIHISEPTRPY